MTSKLPSSSAFSPLSATLVLLAAGPITTWSVVMLLMLIAGVVEIGGGFKTYLGLLVFSFLGALACRRAVTVLRTSPGGSHKSSRGARALMLVGIVALAQLPIMILTNDTYRDTLKGPVLLIVVGGLMMAIVGALLSLRRREWQKASE